MTVSNKIQIVLGGTSGMGLATAKALGKQGIVVIGGRNIGRLEKAVKELKEEGIEVYGKQCDVSDRKSLDEFVKYASGFGSISNVVNAAAIDQGDPEMIWKINAIGTVNVVETFLPIVDHSCIVLFTSITAYFYKASEEEMKIWENPNAEDFFEKALQYSKTNEVDPRIKHLGSSFVTYMASKCFVKYYTAANTIRFGKKNSRIFSVSPGSFETPMLKEASNGNMSRYATGTAFNRNGKPEEMADFISKLISIEYLTGVDLILDGGKTAIGSVKQFE
ncbi:hypothetical protein PIROE2DRAFT_10817 [Piromyces sp. E2]|nr:hypothetical protein PIROE2DRAFT_10817 [Piromyces sp. E2]|eukprot:OUM62784.1 hypothetical protein PIROE2DRAFT_10817 [Piromyces sp. E2]